MKKTFETSNKEKIAWCPGCGNFAIRNALISALDELELNPSDTVFSSGIGQAAKMPQYVNTNYFNGLHGRGLPVAVAVKSSNPSLTVIAEGGDGDMYGEGGNHFIHNVRRNPDITHIVHNNMVYGLTKGQASPTSRLNFKTPVQVMGVTNEPFNPIAVALSLGATFTARGFSGDMDQLKEIFKSAILHKGYSLVDVFHPCVSFNKINTLKWYKDHSHYLDENYDRTDLNNAINVSLDVERFALGVIYENKEKPVFEEMLMAYKDSKVPLYKRKRNISDVYSLLE